MKGSMWWWILTINYVLLIYLEALIKYKLVLLLRVLFRRVFPPPLQKQHLTQTPHSSDILHEIWLTLMPLSRCLHEDETKCTWERKLQLLFSILQLETAEMVTCGKHSVNYVGGGKQEPRMKMYVKYEWRCRDIFWGGLCKFAWFK